MGEWKPIARIVGVTTIGAVIVAAWPLICLAALVLAAVGLALALSYSTGFYAVALAKRLIAQNSGGPNE